jgi:hypothetical protein
MACQGDFIEAISLTEKFSIILTLRNVGKPTEIFGAYADRIEKNIKSINNTLKFYSGSRYSRHD